MTTVTQTAACAVSTCTEPSRSRGWCNPHYQRWYQHGDPEWTAPTTVEKFWARVDKAVSPPCWLWIGPLHASGRTGYGWTGQYLAHRRAYELEVGPIPAGLQLDHLCRTRLCVNPEHLEPVTARVNVLRSDAPGSRSQRTGLCAKGLHPMSGRNLYVVKATGGRRCLACVAIREGKPYEHLLV